jgi:hypothetical protein
MVSEQIMRYPFATIASTDLPALLVFPMRWQVYC